MMKKFLSTILTLGMIFSISGCISSGGGGDSGGDSSSSAAALDKSDVTLVFNLADGLALNSTGEDVVLAKIIDFITQAKTAYATPLYHYVNTLYIKVTGSGISAIEQTQAVSGATGNFSVTLSVPNGDDRVFYVELKDRNDNVLYSGTIIIDVGDNQGVPQDITINVTMDTDVSADDYVDLGRDHLEKHELEKAYIAFDTAVGIDADHPVANFFRGFTQLLLLIQKDDPAAGVASPDADITSALNLYIYGGTDDIYTSGDNIAPDIYDQTYSDNLSVFLDTWARPTGLTTDAGVDLIGNVVLPQIENVINDLANAAKDPVFYTTLTTGMHFDLLSEVKVDIGDIKILEAVAYGLKAYYNHILAYEFRSSIDYWDDEFSKEYPEYTGIQNIIDNSPSGVGELVGGSAVYFSNAKAAYSTGADKIKSALREIDKRSSVNRDGHIFNIAEGEDSQKIISTLDDVQLALNSPPAVVDFDGDTAELDLSKLFSTPDINSLPEIYYHAESEEELPVLDTNLDDTSAPSFFDPTLDGVIKEINGTAITKDGAGLINLLREQNFSSDYKFPVPAWPGTTFLNGLVSDFGGLRPSMVEEENSYLEPWRDLTDVYVAKDATYLYVGLKLRGGPRPTLATDEEINYTLHCNAREPVCNWDESPVTIMLFGDTSGWGMSLYSYGTFIPGADLSSIGYHKDGDVIEFKIPIAAIVNIISNYQGTGWDGKELFVACGVSSNIGGKQGGDSIGDCLAELNISIP
ncbi:MAG: hypothetical protein ABH843_03505 [Candidatus Omnitrophota bacterium]